MKSGLTSTPPPATWCQSCADLKGHRPQAPQTPKKVAFAGRISFALCFGPDRGRSAWITLLLAHGIPRSDFGLSIGLLICPNDFAGALGEIFLRSLCRVDGARELDQHTVASGLDDAGRGAILGSKRVFRSAFNSASVCSSFRPIAGYSRQYLPPAPRLVVVPRARRSRKPPDPAKTISKQGPRSVAN